MPGSRLDLGNFYGNAAMSCCSNMHTCTHWQPKAWRTRQSSAYSGQPHDGCVSPAALPHCGLSRVLYIFKYIRIPPNSTRPYELDGYILTHRLTVLDSAICAQVRKQWQCCSFMLAVNCKVCYSARLTRSYSAGQGWRRRCLHWVCAVVVSCL